MCVCVCIYIYIYRERGGEREFTRLFTSFTLDAKQ